MEAFWQEGLTHAFCVSTQQSEQLAELLAPVLLRTEGLEQGMVALSQELAKARGASLQEGGLICMRVVLLWALPEQTLSGPPFRMRAHLHEGEALRTPPDRRRPGRPGRLRAASTAASCLR